MSSDPPADETYSAADIRTLRGAAHVRLNPGMYIGDIGPAGLHHLLFGLVDGSLAEAAAGRGRQVRVTLHADGSAEVADDGRSLPAGESGPADLEDAFTRWWGWSAYGGRQWLDYAVAGALSERLEAEIRGGGRATRQAFARGEPVGPPGDAGPAAGDGLRVHFHPDPTVFGPHRLDPAAVRDRLRTAAFLHSGVRLTLAVPPAAEEAFEYADGVRACVERLGGDRPPLHPHPFVVRGEDGGVRFEVGLRWGVGEDRIEMGFVNGRHTPDGGTHVTGLRQALTRCLNRHARRHLPGVPALRGGQARGGLTAVASVWMREPAFEGATRNRLSSPEAGRAVQMGLVRALPGLLGADPGPAERVIRAAVGRPSGGPVGTAEEWAGTDDVPRMLRCVGDGRRKAVLLVAGWLRVYPPCGGNRHDRKAVAALEAFADGAAEAAGVRRRRWTEPTVRATVMAATAPGFGPAGAARLGRDLCRGAAGGLAGLVREVFGNPFRPAVIDPSWQTATVLALARQMYDTREFTALPILADALQDAGCEHADILEHCRGTGPHARGCWVVDLLLGKE